MEMKGENWAFGKAAERTLRVLKLLKEVVQQYMPGMESLSKTLGSEISGFGHIKGLISLGRYFSTGFG